MGKVSSFLFRYYKSLYYFTPNPEWVMGESTEFLFCLFDAGETFGLAPVMECLEEEGRDYRVLVMGTASEIAHSQAGIPKHRLLDLNKNFCIYPRVQAENWPREKPLSLLSLPIRCSVLVTGLVSRIQAQIAELFHKKGIPVVGFYDNLMTELSDFPLKRMVEKLLPITSQIILPNSLVAEGFGDKGTVLGQPAIERALERIQESDLGSLKAKVGLSLDKATVLFLGAYSASYERALRIFLKGVQRAVDSGSHEILLQIHPKFSHLPISEILEFGVAREMGINVFFSNGDVSTQEAIAISDLAVSEYSTALAQAVFAGKPSYQVVPQQDYQNPLSERRLIRILHTAEEVEKALQLPYTSSGKGSFEAIGMPQGSKEAIAELIKKEGLGRSLCSR